MTSNTVAGLYARLGIDQSHSRPHVSNDNPYSEANFKTLKYCPAFPGEFGSIEDVNVFCRDFFWYYNNEHRHSGSRCTPQRRCTTDPGSPSKPAAPPPSTPPTEPTPGGSTAAPGRARCLPTRGSTNRPQPAPRRTSHHRPRKQPDVSFDLTDSVPVELARENGRVASGRMRQPVPTWERYEQAQFRLSRARGQSAEGSRPRAVARGQSPEGSRPRAVARGQSPEGSRPEGSRPRAGIRRALAASVFVAAGPYRPPGPSRPTRRTHEHKRIRLS